MQYLGGKTRLAKRLVAAMAPYRRGRPFWEPFCGGLSVSVELAKGGPGLVSDANPALIALYKGVANGWQPPESLSEEMHAFAKKLPDDQPLKAFAGFGCSFGGTWFGTYARSPVPTRNYAATCARALARDIGALLDSGARVEHLDFLAFDPQPTPYFLYLDPPYRGTTGYKGVPDFDHDRFYERVRGWSRYTDVFVSEFEMPWGLPIVEFERELSPTFQTAAARRGHSAKRIKTERLYHYSPEHP